MPSITIPASLLASMLRQADAMTDAQLCAYKRQLARKASFATLSRDDNTAYRVVNATMRQRGLAQ